MIESLKQITHALDLRSNVFQQFEKLELLKNNNSRERYLNFVVVVAGPTGMELCGALSESYNGHTAKLRSKRTGSTGLSGSGGNMAELHEGHKDHTPDDITQGGPDLDMELIGPGHFATGQGGCKYLDRPHDYILITHLIDTCLGKMCI